MIVVDTSVWVDHLRVGDAGLAALLGESRVLVHPWVIGELALGRLARRDEMLGLLSNLPQTPVATEGEVLTLIDERGLSGKGIGYVDAHLVAATLLRPGARLWSRDKRLTAVALDLGLAWGGDHQD